MGKTSGLTFSAMLLAFSISTPVLADAVIGAPAPAFESAKTSHGETVSLRDFKGKTVVLEWTNDGCPFVQKHYQSGNMQKLQKEAADQGIVWLSVISSAPGKQGYRSAAEVNEMNRERDAHPADVILDPAGEVGLAYQAKTTPHMYIIDPQGVLIYKGGIDDTPSTRIEDIKTAKNYVRAAFAEMAAGAPISEASTRPYGCAVKYAD